MDRPQAYGWAERINADAPSGITAEGWQYQGQFSVRLTMSEEESPPVIILWDGESCRGMFSFLHDCKEREART